jgi:hypothetical protein
MKTLIYLGIILTLASCGPNKEEGPNKEQIKEEERMRVAHPKSRVKQFDIMLGNVGKEEWQRSINRILTRIKINGEGISVTNQDYLKRQFAVTDKIILRALRDGDNIDGVLENVNNVAKEFGFDPLSKTDIEDMVYLLYGGDVRVLNAMGISTRIKLIPDNELLNNTDDILRGVGYSEEEIKASRKAYKDRVSKDNPKTKEEIEAAEKESAVTAESQQEASSSDGNGESEEQEAKYDLGNMLGQGGGSDEGTGGGDGLGHGGGIGDGSTRKVYFNPNLDNLTTTPAKVAVKIKINNEGKVYWSEAQLSNPFTNTTVKTIIKLAEKKALEFTYKPTSASTKYDVDILKLEFKVN